MYIICTKTKRPMNLCVKSTIAGAATGAVAGLVGGLVYTRTKSKSRSKKRSGGQDVEAEQAAKRSGQAEQREAEREAQREEEERTPERRRDKDRGKDNGKNKGTDKGKDKDKGKGQREAFQKSLRERFADNDDVVHPLLQLGVMCAPGTPAAAQFDLLLEHMRRLCALYNHMCCTPDAPVRVENHALIAMRRHAVLVALDVYVKCLPPPARLRCEPTLVGDLMQYVEGYGTAMYHAVDRAAEERIARLAHRPRR